MPPPMSSPQQPRIDQILSSIMAHNRDDSPLVDFLCASCMDAVSVNGVGLTLMSDGEHQGVVASTDETSALIAELQFTLGEGPSIDASHTGRPVFHPHMARTGVESWPMFGPAILDAEVGAIFAIPLQVGAIRLGVLNLYRHTPGLLDGDQLTETFAFAEAAVVLLLYLQDQIVGDRLSPQLVSPLDSQPQIHQSTGMISVQAAVSLAEALILLRARAFADDRPILDVANDVISRTLSFRIPDDDPLA